MYYSARSYHKTKVIKYLFYRNILQKQPEELQGASPEFNDFLTRLLDKNPSTRLGANNSMEVLSHPFLIQPVSLNVEFIKSINDSVILSDTFFARILINIY